MSSPTVVQLRRLRRGPSCLPRNTVFAKKKSISEQQYALQFAILKKGKIGFSVTKVVDQRLSISGAVTVSMCAEVKQITAINPTSL